MLSLFSPMKIGSLELRNRIFMAPMTRGRAQQDGTPNPIMAKYYEQRASAGLIVTEATAVSAQGVGWVNAPGIFTNQQERAWRDVPTAVHNKGGCIFLQLWHMGRVSHPDFQNGKLPVAPSAIAAQGQSHTPQGQKPYVEPRALEKSELAGIVQDYVAAAKRAIACGFDGVEIHGANGYLIDQFIRDGSNKRTDEYGGRVANRWRFPLEVASGICAAIGKERTGFRVSPGNAYNGMSDSNVTETFVYGAKSLNELGLAYIHVMEPLPGHFFANDQVPRTLNEIKSVFTNGAVIANGGYDRSSGNHAIADGHADAVAYGVPFLANPDLVERYRDGVDQFNPPHMDTFYTPGEKGYTDYPALG